MTLNKSRVRIHAARRWSLFIGRSFRVKGGDLLPKPALPETRARLQLLSVPLTQPYGAVGFQASLRCATTQTQGRENAARSRAG